MESHREEQKKALEPDTGQKPNRFRILKLEERIAPKKGESQGGRPTSAYAGCTGCCYMTNW